MISALLSLAKANCSPKCFRLTPDAASAAAIEISTSAFLPPNSSAHLRHHQGAVSTPGLPCHKIASAIQKMLARQLQRGLDLHEKCSAFGPKGCGHPKQRLEEVLSIAHSLGVNWMATDEGVLGRTRGIDVLP